MVETNEEISLRLKQAIHDYYMGFVKQNFKSSLANGKEAEISSQIMQFLDAQLDTNNSHISKEDISRILSSILVDDFSDSFHSEFDEKRITHCFPEICDIKIEDGNAALLFERVVSPLSDIKERSSYLYVSPDFYNSNIVNIENEIKKLEKGFSRQDFKDFENKFNEDLSLKQYELESARVYESASSQIEQKKQKFNCVSAKLINDYGRKYDEIASRDISDEEKTIAFDKLLAETKFYDEKNRQAVARLNNEYEKLNENFNGKLQASHTTYSQMQNLHLFDKNRYFEDMMSAKEPKLQDLYKKRFLLNSYRVQNNLTVYDGKPNVFKHFVTNVFNSIRSKNAPLMLGPHFERDFNNGLQTNSSDNDVADKNLVRALAEFYGRAVPEISTDFENCLVHYFKDNYRELIQDNDEKFLFRFSDKSDENSNGFDEGDLFKLARQFDIDTSVFDNHFGSNLVVKDGLIYENGNDGVNVIYATDKAINGIASDLYGEALYYSHLARESASKANVAADLQKDFMKYAENNGIELSDVSKAQAKRRFVKRKANNKVIDFKQM